MKRLTIAMMLLVAPVWGCGSAVHEDPGSRTVERVDISSVPARIPDDVLKTLDAMGSDGVVLADPAELTDSEQAEAAKALAKQTGGDKIAGLARARISRVGGDHAGYLAWFDDVVPPGNFGPAGSEQADDPPGDKIVVYDADFTVRDVYYF